MFSFFIATDISLYIGVWLISFMAIEGDCMLAATMEGKIVTPSPRLT